MSISSVMELRFDVETISKATEHGTDVRIYELRFDVETISKATNSRKDRFKSSCGLM